MAFNIYGFIQILFVGAFTLSSLGVFMMLIKKIKFKEVKKTVENKISVVSSFPLGHRKKIFMLEVENKNFLIGVTDYKVETLFTFDKKKEKSKPNERFSQTLLSKNLDFNKLKINNNFNEKVNA